MTRLIVFFPVLMVCAALSTLYVFSQPPEPAQPVLSVPCRIVEVYDGDTVTVEMTLRARVRLIDCWAPEVRGPERAEGLRSRDNLREHLDREGDLGTLIVPLYDRLDKSFSFGRVLGHVRIRDSPETLSEYQVRTGFATREKPSHGSDDAPTDDADQ